MGHEILNGNSIICTFDLLSQDTQWMKLYWIVWIKKRTNTSKLQKRCHRILDSHLHLCLHWQQALLDTSYGKKYPSISKMKMIKVHRHFLMCLHCMEKQCLDIWTKSTRPRVLIRISRKGVRAKSPPASDLQRRSTQPHQSVWQDAWTMGASRQRNSEVILIGRSLSRGRTLHK